MNKDMDLILSVKKQEKVSEKELFGKIKEFLDKAKEEYPQIALVSMIMDSFETGSSIFRLNKRLESSELQTDFIEISKDYCKIANNRLSKLNNGNDGIPPKPKGIGYPA